MNSITFFFQTWNNHKQMLVSMIICGIFIFAIYVGDLLIPLSSITMDTSIASQGPSSEHIFGVDWIGRDMFKRTVKGLAGSLRVGVIAAFMTLIIATILAIISAATCKKLDQMVGILTDMFLGVPHLVIMVLISASLGGGELGIIISVATTHWPSLTRILRAEILQLREEEYVKISKQFGKTDWFIAKKHMLLHLLPQIMVRFILLFPHVILHEAAITFLGFGLSPLEPAIGVILSESAHYIAIGLWWLVVFPGASLLLMVVGFENIGECLRKMISPNSVH